MFEYALPGIPRFITMLAEWGTAAIFILLLEKRRIRLKTAGKIILWGILFFIIHYLFVTYFQKTFMETILNMIICILLMCCFIGFCAGGNIFAALGYGACAFSMAEFMASAEWFISTLIFGADKSLRDIGPAIFLACCFTLMICGFYYIEKKMISGLCNMNWKQAALFILMAVLTLIISNIGFLLPWAYSGEEIKGTLSVVRGLVDFAAVAIIFLLQRGYQEESIKTELAAINNMLNLQYKQYLDFKMNTEYISRQSHDLKHQIAALRNACTEEEREKYLEEMEWAIKKYDAQQATGNPVLDSILTQKQMQCMQKNIQLICNADGRMLKNLAVRDISIIFGNILDNAMECVAKYENEEDRIIQGSVYIKQGFLMIQFDNRCYEELNFEKGVPVTTKADKNAHGYGITSIIYTVKKNNGHVDVECKDEWFSIRILIPLPSAE